MSLLANCTSGGCGAKIGKGELTNILKSLPSFDHADLLVGFDSSDDAAVYKLSDELAIVSTVDFFSPMIDDPRAFGRIAAANALSDIYAMGGDILFALNLVCFPEKMDKSILGEILAGGAEKVQEAGGIISGGHSIYDKEIKYGLSVTGKVNPKNILRNNNCRLGDQLILTKPLGVGIILAAARGEMAGKEAVNKATFSMERLNKYAAQKMKEFDVHACTDITGFGFLAHAYEMVENNNSLAIFTEHIPIFKESYEYAKEYLLTAAGQRNRNYMKDKVELSHIDFPWQEIMLDPQTSGGLLISVSEHDAKKLLAAIKEVEPMAAIVGEVIKKEDKNIILL